ncbi:MAG: hypothetical protein LIO62_04245 [Clostridiales bacterium]|nr:hypothetical protein [Clostridiales bacterium]
MDNINDIISSLSAEDIDMLKGVASSILGGENTWESTDSPATQTAKPGNTGNNNNNNNGVSNNNAGNSVLPAGLGLDSMDFEMIMKAKTIFEKMNNTKSKNADLILALKPHLSPETQNKADQALRILKLFEVLPLLRELF